jgi:hypothetical protein
VLLALLVVVPAARGGVCPSAAELEARLPGLGLDRGARSVLYGFDTPADSYARAAGDPGEPVVEREGDRAYAVMLVEIPVERMWKAVNDQEHHGGRLVDVSMLLAGDAHGSGRLVLQHMSRMGFGRWWAVRIHHGEELYRRTGGRLWEQTWELALDDVDPSRPPVRAVARKLDPIASNRGAWLLVPLSPRCTLIDYYVESDVGGFLSVFQGLVAKKALRDALEAVTDMAGDHLDTPHPGPPFTRPDGSRMP